MFVGSNKSTPTIISMLAV